MNPFFKINAKGQLEANPEEVRKHLQKDPRFAPMLKDTILSKTISELLSTEISHQQPLVELYDSLKNKKTELEKSIGKEKTDRLLKSLSNAIAGSKLAMQAIEQNLFLHGRPIDISNTSKEEISLRLGKCLNLIANAAKFLKDGIQFHNDFVSNDPDLQRDLVKIEKISGLQIKKNVNDVSTTLIRPVQRGPRYQLLGAEIARNLEKAKYDTPDPVNALNEILSKKSPADARRLASADANTALGYLAILKKTELKDLKSPAHFSNANEPLNGHSKGMEDLLRALKANNEASRIIENEHKNVKEITNFIKEQKLEITAKKVPQKINLRTLASLLNVQIKAKEPNLNHLSVKVKNNNEITLKTLEGNELIKITQKGRDIKFELNTPKAKTSKLTLEATVKALESAANSLHTAMLTQKLEEKPEVTVRYAPQEKAPSLVESLYNTVAKWQGKLSQKHQEQHKNATPDIYQRLQAAQNENSINGHRGISTTQKSQREDSISQRSRSNSFLSFTKPAKPEQLQLKAEQSQSQDASVTNTKHHIEKILKRYTEILNKGKGVEKAKKLIETVKSAKNMEQVKTMIDSALNDLGNKKESRFSMSSEYELKLQLEVLKKRHFSTPEVKEKPKLK